MSRLIIAAFAKISHTSRSSIEYENGSLYFADARYIVLLLLGIPKPKIDRIMILRDVPCDSSKIDAEMLMFCAEVSKSF